MSAGNNADLVRRVFDEILNNGDLNVADEVIAPGYINFNFPGMTPGPNGFKQVAEMFRTAFPDINITLDDVIVDDDKVATRGVCSGTHRGDFMGINPTGKQVRFNYIDLWRAEDGKLVENWVQMDMLSLMQQLGVVPAPEQDAASSR